MTSETGWLSPAERARREARALAAVTEDEWSLLEWVNQEAGLGLGRDALTRTLSDQIPKRLEHLSEAAGILAAAMRRSQAIMNGEQ